MQSQAANKQQRPENSAAFSAHPSPFARFWDAASGTEVRKGVEQPNGRTAEQLGRMMGSDGGREVLRGRADWATPSV